MVARQNAALLKSIVVGTDFSVCAARALGHAVSLAQLSGAKLHIVHVLLEPVQALDVAAALPYPDVEVRKEWEGAARARLDRLRPQERPHGQIDVLLHRHAADAEATRSARALE